jgi:uncharacterized Zn-finger protein
MPIPKHHASAFQGRFFMSQQAIQSTEEIVSCSDHGGHPLVYINIKNGSKSCQYCGQRFEYSKPATSQASS